jgi:hypothetical protein
MICCGCEVKRIMRKEKALVTMWELHLYMHQDSKDIIPKITTPTRVFNGTLDPVLGPYVGPQITQPIEGPERQETWNSRHPGT